MGTCLCTSSGCRICLTACWPYSRGCRAVRHCKGVCPFQAKFPGVLGNLLALLQGLQSDADFAEVFARSKWRQSRWAPSRIRMELVKRGVAKQHIEAGLESVFGEHSERLNVDFQEAEAPDLSALHGGLIEM